MSEDQIVHGSHADGRRRLIMLIVGAIVVAIGLTACSMWLYVSTGAAQVDLSGPGFKSVRKDASSNKKFDGFSATGDIDEKSLAQFEKLYSQQMQRATSIDAFGGAVLDDTSLKIDDPAMNTGE